MSIEGNVTFGINIALDIYSFLVVAFIFSSVIINQSNRFRKDKWLILTFISELIWTFADIFTWICSGTSHRWFVIVLPIANFIYYLTGFLNLYFFSNYLYILIGGVILTKNYRKFVSSTLIIYSIFLLLTPFTGFLYTIDANNIYSRGKFFFIPVVLQLFIYISLILFLIRNKRIINFKKLYAYFAFMLIPQIMQIIQLAFYGISLINVGYSLAFILIFIDMINNLEKGMDRTFDVVRQKDARLIQIQNSTILGLSSLVEERDADTGGHVQRTSDYVKTIATLLMEKGYYKNIIDDNYIQYLEKAAPMHDIGKIVVPDAVLKKPGRLTPEEFEEMKRHALEGGRIIMEVLSDYDDKSYIKISKDISTFHHEKWNGSGYPNGLKGEQIPLSARIMAIADVFDALVSPRIYKEPMSYEKAFEIIEEGKGQHFDPLVAEVFLENKEIMISINENYIKSSILNTANHEPELETLEEV